MAAARLGQQISSLARGLAGFAAVLVLTLAPLAPALAAPAKKAARSAETSRKPVAAKPAAQAAAGRSAQRSGGPRAVGKARPAGKRDVARNDRSTRGGKQLAAQRGQRIGASLSARQTRLSLRGAAAAPQIARAPRLSFGHTAGLHEVADPLDLKSSVALVLDQDTDEVLLKKNDHAVLPIASLTKLMTGLVVSDAQLPLDELLTIAQEDVDTEKGSRSRLAVGTQLTRGELMHLALMSSENRAAHALGRTYPGGLQRFVGLMNERALMLGMKDSRFVEPTGLSSANRSSAHDLATLVAAAHREPLLRQLSTSTGYEVAVGSRVLQYNNTNRLVHDPEWQIGLQKTGFISEAGQCLVMQARVAGRKLIMVFLDASGKQGRLADAERVRRWVEERYPANTVAGNQNAG